MNNDDLKNINEVLIYIVEKTLEKKHINFEKIKDVFEYLKENKIVFPNKNEFDIAIKYVYFNSFFQYLNNKSLDFVNFGNDAIQFLYLKEKGEDLNIENIPDSIKTIYFELKKEMNLETCRTISKIVSQVRYNYSMYKKEINIGQKNSNEPIYLDFEKVIFTKDKDFFKAENVLFNNNKVKKIEILGDLDKGIEILNKIKKKYNCDYQQLCAELEIEDYNNVWTDEPITLKAFKDYLKNEVKMTVVVDSSGHEEVAVWFDLNEDIFGGHNPILYLYADIDYNFVGIE